MRAQSIFRRLREMDVPIERAKLAAERYGDDHGTPTPAEKLLQEISRAAKKKAVQQFRREYRAWCRANDLPLPVFEYTFAKRTRGREWRLDIAWPDVDGTGGVYLENDGGAWVGGRHTRPKGFIADQEKRNAAVSLGWKPLHCTPQTLYADATLQALHTLLTLDNAQVDAHDRPTDAVDPVGAAAVGVPVNDRAP